MHEWKLASTHLIAFIWELKQENEANSYTLERNVIIDYYIWVIHDQLSMLLFKVKSYIEKDAMDEL